MELKTWSNTNSILLSRAVTIFFAVALVLVDIFGYWIVSFVCETLLARNPGLYDGVSMMACLYICSVPAYILLYHLYRLLENIAKEQVFILENVGHLRYVSWCCTIACIVCLLFVWVWPSYLIVSLAAGFMALIVRVIKNIILQAIEMKTELDFTV